MALMDKDSAVLQGAFLLADKLSLPSSLSSLQKADWSRVGHLVLEAVREICGQEELGVHLPAASNGLPEVNYVVLLEVVRSLAAAPIFSRFLLHLPQSQIATELERLVQHVRSGPTRDDDVRFLLEVWWELWKGQDEQKEEGEDSIEKTFAGQFARLSSKSSSLSPQAAKRLKLDASDLPASPPTADVVNILLHALKDIKDNISTTDLCLQALSIALDTLYTAFLIDGAVVLPAIEKMHILSKVVSIREQNGEKLTPELLKEALRDLHASHTPSQFEPTRIKLGEALKIITDLAQFWQSNGLLGTSESSGSAFKLEQSVQRVLTALQEAEAPETTNEIDLQKSEKNILRGFLESLSFPAAESTPGLNSRVTAVIIKHRLDDYQNFAELFASEKSWAAQDELWFDCLEKNQAAFQRQETLINLTSTIVSKLHSESPNVSQCRKLMKVVADIFSALSLEDKNKALAAMLRLSSRGFFGGSVPSAVTVAFEQELNMAFNCIIQGRGGASAAASQANLNTAVSLVARVVFQNPEAALRCLQEMTKTKSLSANEREQLLKFLGLLMMPVMAAEGEEERMESFLTPQEVVNVFVLPNLSTTGHRCFDIELSLQLLHTALSVDAPVSPHWVLGCSPFPLLYVLAQLLNQTLRCWEQTPEGAVHRWSMDTKELLEALLTRLGQLVGAEVAASPSSWSRALFWLYHKMERLDWTIRFHLKPVWRDHFKNEVPASLLTVCDLPEQEWSGVDLPQYGQGTGLLAWMECCCASDSLRTTMLSRLSLDQRRADHVGMFSKGLLVAVTQTLPWCSVSQWGRLLGVLRELITSARLHVPFSLERFSCELRLSVLLLRVLQLLCGSSCSDWLSAEGWGHVGRLYAHAVREVMNSVRAKLPLPASAPLTVSTPPKISKELCQKSPLKSKESHMEEEGETAPCQEVLFVLSQLFCHVQHIQVMMPGGQCEPLFLCSLEILSHYEAIMAAFPHSSSSLESDNTRHFFSTITDNLQSQEMKAVLQQKIAQLVSTAA
ncbi:Gem-associated protein 4 [Dissostichus eleginoides]|uniref:Gem-associated protein 4 n=1 Tax=Dissostichus eleginoides TaxID=100907 RepID=A0AAD9CCU3_DISEL|nr:Gem-associated protein 4 [Dissostichus eleginoides]